MSLRMDKLDFPRWLEQEIKKAGFNQSSLATAANIDRQLINNYVNGKRDNPDDGQKIFRFDKR